MHRAPTRVKSPKEFRPPPHPEVRPARELADYVQRDWLLKLQMSRADFANGRPLSDMAEHYTCNIKHQWMARCICLACKTDQLTATVAG
jgi:hypothetical protein